MPALFLGIPGLPFGAARAASLATSVVTASRSNWLYWREGTVERGAALLLGAGALLGAAGGVALSHREGWAEVGRYGLACVLLFVSVRFARDGVGRAREG